MFSSDKSCKLLQGGFARCYELTDTTDKQVHAGKIVSKSLLTKKHQKDKVILIVNGIDIE